MLLFLDSPVSQSRSWGVLIGVFEDKDYSSSADKDFSSSADINSSSSREYFVCSNTDGKMDYPKIATLVINEAEKTVEFKSIEKKEIYADLEYSRDQTNKPEIFAYSKSKNDGLDIERIRFDRNTQQMLIGLRYIADKSVYYSYQCRQSN